MTNTLETIGRQKLRESLEQCTDDQVHFFNRMYKSVDVIEFGQINWAIQQVERTIEQNSKEQS